jgi:uncharacterized protein
MLQVNVSQLLKSPVGETRHFTIDDSVNILDTEQKVQGEVELIRTNRSVLVRGTLQTQVELSCSRCLCQYTCPLNIKIEEEFFPSRDVVSGVSLPSPEEPGSFLIDEHHILDLTDAIRQYAVMGTPMKPLCREDCAGICPTCGKNKNIETCNCPPESPDSHWAELRKLFPAKKESRKRETE